MSLASRQCVPCRGGTPPITGDHITELHRQLDERWEVIDEHHLTREFAFDDFANALSYVNSVAEIAEEQGHHPDIYLAAKIDALRRA